MTLYSCFYCGADMPEVSGPQICDKCRETVAVPRYLALSILGELKDSWDAIGGCDHSVNICACSLRDAIDALSETLGTTD